MCVCVCVNLEQKNKVSGNKWVCVCVCVNLERERRKLQVTKVCVCVCVYGSYRKIEGLKSDWWREVVKWRRLAKGSDRIEALVIIRTGAIIYKWAGRELAICSCCYRLYYYIIAYSRRKENGGDLFHHPCGWLWEYTNGVSMVRPTPMAHPSHVKSIFN